MAASTSLLATKYAPPQLRPGVVVRPELLAVLEAARGTVLVSAPPGYGKTTLIASWLAASGRTTAWLTLDDSDNDAAVFLAYLVAAVRRVLPAFDAATEQPAAALPYSPQALTPLLNALLDAGPGLAIVLDDYQVIRDRDIHESAAFLATHLPAGVRLVIGTREDPPLPLSRLRVRGQLAEIRAADLRLDDTSAAEFLRRSMRLDVSDDAVERLNDRTEGWVAGLQLAGLSLRTAPDPDAFVEAFDASDRYVVDYLGDEALARQPGDVRAFLADTSVLDRLTAPLCDALTGRSDGAEVLAALERANMFLTPLDERREWFRYHPLFADLLRSGLPAARRSELHRAAAAWLAEHELPLDAIRHALAGGDAERAAALMEAIADVTIARGEFRTIAGWCDALPRDVLARHAELRVSRAWAEFFLGDLAAAEVDAAALRKTGSGAPASPRLAVLDAWLANRRDDPEARTLARRAVASITNADPIFRSLALGTLAEALVGTDIREAAAAFEEAQRLAAFAPRSTLSLGGVYSLATAYLILGRRRAAERLCRETIAAVADRRGGGPPAVGMVHLALGIALFEADELGQARQHFAVGFELCDRAGLHVTMLGAAEWYEVLTLHALGETQQAWRRLESVRREGERHGMSRIAIAMDVLASELLVAEGDPRGAERRLRQVPARFSNLLGSVVERIRRGQALVLFALDRPRDALAVLEPLAPEQRDAGRSGRLVRTLVLMAAAQRRAGDRTAAGASLAEAVGIAADEDLRRAFVEQPAIDRVLPAVRPSSPAFVDDLLTRLGRSLRPEMTSARSIADGDLAEPLTVRELEVLRLVVAGLSNEEIGGELFVTAGTAKWHVHNLLGKLGARDRVGLVAKSRELRLL